METDQSIDSDLDNLKIESITSLIKVTKNVLNISLKTLTIFKLNR
jgi:hypothetical protein